MSRNVAPPVSLVFRVSLITSRASRTVGALSDTRLVSPSELSFVFAPTRSPKDSQPVALTLSVISRPRDGIGHDLFEVVKKVRIEPGLLQDRGDVGAEFAQDIGNGGDVARFRGRVGGPSRRARIQAWRTRRILRTRSDKTSLHALRSYSQFLARQVNDARPRRS